MDGDLLGDMAFAAPSAGDASQSQPMVLPTPTMDLLSGSPIKTKEQAPPASSINTLENGQEADAEDGGSLQVSRLPFSDNPIQFEDNQTATPQEHQHTNANDLLHLPASSMEPAPADPFAGVRSFSDDPQPASAPFAPPTQQTTGDASFDPFSDQPTAPQTDAFAAPAASSTAESGFDPFLGQPPPAAAPDLFAAPLVQEGCRTVITDPPVVPFVPKEQPDNIPLGAQTSDLTGNSAATSDENVTPNDVIGNSDDGDVAPESEGKVGAAETERSSSTTKAANDEADDHSKLEESTTAPGSAQSPLDSSSDKKSPIEMASNITEANASAKKEPAADSSHSPDPPVSSTLENFKEKDGSSGESKESLTRESATNPPTTKKPQNGSDVKLEKIDTEDGNAAPTETQIQGKPSQPKPNAANTQPLVHATQQTSKAREPVKVMPAKKMGMANQKLDFGMASNMFRSFSSKSGAQLKQLQSKGGASLKFGLSRLGEASSNLADTVKQKNAATTAFKVEEVPRPEKMLPTERHLPLKGAPITKDASSTKNENEMPNASSPLVDSATKVTASEEKKDEGNVVQSEQTNGSKAPAAPVTSATIVTVAPGKKVAAVLNPSAEPVKARSIASAESESTGKDVKQGLTAASVTSLFGLKIEKLPTAPTTVDKAKPEKPEKKKTVSKKVQREDDKGTSSTQQSEKHGNNGLHISETVEESAKEAALVKEFSAGDSLNQSATGEAASEEWEKKEEIARKALETKRTKTVESAEEKKQEPVENPVSSEVWTSENGERREATAAQGEAISEQTVEASELIAALENDLRNSKEGSSKRIQLLEKELQISKDGATKQIQALQQELQASKDGSSRLIKSLEKKLHASQETVKQLKEKSTKLQQGAEENELKKDLIEDLNSRLQTEMGKRQESESTGKKTKEKLDKVVEQFNVLQKTSKERLLQMKGAIDKLMLSNKKMEEEIVGIREERDEQGRRLSSYTTELNEAKKQFAIKINASDHYELKMNELDVQLKKTRDQMGQIKFERDRLRKELGNWKKYAEERNKQLEGQLNHEKKLNEERKRRMKLFAEAKTEEARSSNVDNVSLQAELDQTTRSLKDFNQRYKQLHSQWVQAQTRNRELQRDMAKMKNDSEKMSKVGGTLEAKLSRYSKEIEDHKSKRLAAKNELMTVIAKLEEEKKASARLRDFVKGTMTPKVLSQYQVLQESADHLDGGVRQLALRFGREFSSLRRKRNGRPDPLADSKPKTWEEIQAMVGDANTARVLSKLEEELQRVTEQISTMTTSVEQLESLLVAPTTKGCVGAMFNF